ncbi:MAG: GTP-sensing pleiotropic transcriptional regulator CodY [Acidobacteriota bacterium]
MAKGLLEKARGIHKILQKIAGNPVEFQEMARVLASNLECSVYIIGRRGGIGGYAFQEGVTCSHMDRIMEFTEAFPESFNQGLMDIQETRGNIAVGPGQCIFRVENVVCSAGNSVMSIVPLYGGARRLGTLLLTKKEGSFADEDIVLAELGAMVVSNEVMRMRTERVEEEARKRAAVQVAVATLSYSEREAIEHIIAELKGREGLLVASRIADKVGITRSVIVSALRKFESAGVIESRSLGMKGTYIKILNDNLFEELEKH